MTPPAPGFRGCQKNTTKERNIYDVIRGSHYVHKPVYATFEETKTNANAYESV
jgi:hypothetical protein